MTPPRSLRDRIAAVVFGILVIVAAFGVTWLLRQGYAVHKLTRGVGDTWFLAADGKRWFRMDEHRRDVPLSEIPEDLRHAFIAVEDHRFYTHPGVDPIALGRAVVRNVTSPGTVEGGSTLTQHPRDSERCHDHEDAEDDRGDPIAQRARRRHGRSRTARRTCSMAESTT